jgi:8-oxo-dGTP pyrophosphatase MutT (NUDIX family)
MKANISNLSEIIRNYKPYNKQEEKDKERILWCIENFQDPLSRDNGIAHFTSSCFILNKSHDKVIMIHHNIYNSWAWTGGHADGNEDLLAVAVKEAEEETGVKNVKPITADIFALDVMPVFSHIRRGEYVSAHLHLNASYILETDEEEELVVKPDENSAVRWIPIDEVLEYSSEPHMIKVYEKIITKIKELKGK